MKKGFTLLELLVVIVIITVLVGVAVPSYFNAAENARMVELKVLWGHQRHWATGRQLTADDIARTNQSLQKHGLKFFTGEIVCRQNVPEGQLCYEAVFTRKSGPAQYQITTVNNFRDLACVPGNVLGTSFCKSRMRPDGQTTVDGQTAYLIH